MNLYGCLATHQIAHLYPKDENKTLDMHVHSANTQPFPQLHGVSKKNTLNTKIEGPQGNFCRR